MITYEEAKRIALERNPRVNACHEYEKAWHFGDFDAEVDGDSGVVVLKEDGRAVSFLKFVLDYAPKRNFRQKQF